MQIGIFDFANEHVKMQMFSFFFTAVSSRPCLYNYTIGAGSPVIITQSDPVCLICSVTDNTLWAIGGNTPSGIPGALYILYMTTPVSTFIGGPMVWYFASGGAHLVMSTGKRSYIVSLPCLLMGCCLQ